MIRLAYPYFLLLLFVIIPILLWGKDSGGRIRFSSLDILKKLTTVRRFHPRYILTILRIVAIIFFVIALSRPQSGRKFTEITSEGIDIMLLLDTSGSMQALDFERGGQRVNRLEIVKEVVKDFIKKRAGDKMGLIVFGEEAFTQCPLTLDHGVLIEFLKKIEIGMAGDATAIGSALGVGVNRMKDIKAKSKIMILLTDGRNTAGQIDPVKASKLAETFNIKTYTIGVGTRGQAPFLVDSLFGKRYVYQNVEIDERTLKEIAVNTGAKYYRATHTEELEKIYDEIDSLEKTKIKSKEYTEYNELFHIFLVIGIFIVLLEIFLGQTLLRKIP